MAELGIARTTLRDIAQNSGFSHGILHYYFTDKIELITCSVRQYKAECVTRYDDAIATTSSPAQFKSEVGALLSGTLRAAGPIHRIWYDLRNFSQFDARYRADVTDIEQSLERTVWRVVSRYSDLADAPILLPCPATYAAFDGLFRRALAAHLAGDRSAADELERDAARLLEVISPSPT